MTRFQPADIEAADLQIALNPALGGEHRVLVSLEPHLHIADVRQPAENSGVLTLDAAYELPAAGKHLQLIVDRAGARANASATELTVSFNVTFEDNATGTATATYDIPDRSRQTSASLPQGAAVDVIPNGVGNAEKKIKQVHQVSGITGGAVNNKFSLVAFPDYESFVLVGCTDQANFTLPIGSSIPIPCGLNASAFVVRGRGEPGSLNVTQKFSGYLDGLTRANGLFVTAMVELQKDERIVTDRFVVTSWRPSASPEFGDGDDIVMSTGESNFAEFAVFTAR